MRQRTKRAIASLGRAAGIGAEDRKYVAALKQLRGSFERGPSELALYVFSLIVAATGMSLLGAANYRAHSFRGWTLGTTLFAFYACCVLWGVYVLVCRANMRYVFEAGTVRAFDTWGRPMWEEDLTGLEHITSFTNQGTTSLTLHWPTHKRRLVAFQSLRKVLDAS
jgi:hypothetical protein